MPDTPEIPTSLAKSLVNLNQGEEVECYCRQCKDVTTQVRISYRELSLPRRSPFTRIVGGALDMIPGFGAVVGKPTLCRTCKTVNRP